MRIFKKIVNSHFGYFKIIRVLVILMIAFTTFAFFSCENELMVTAKAMQAEAVSPRIIISNNAETDIASGGSFSFGIVVETHTSIDKVLTIRNSGKSSLLIDLDAITIRMGLGTTAGTFTIKSLSSETIAPNTEAELILSFSPISEGTKNAVLTIPTNDFNTPSFILNLTGDVGMLSALAISSGTLTPAFSTGITSYTVTVDQSVSGLTVSGTKADPSATLSINPSQPMILNEGTNTITATVTAPNGASMTYTMNVTRVPSPPTIDVAGAGITRTVTITPPASCPSAISYYTTNGIDVSQAGNRISFTGPVTLKVAGMGVQVTAQAISVVNNLSSAIAVVNTSKIAYPDLVLAPVSSSISLPNVYAAVAIDGTIFYSDDQGSIKKSDTPYSTSTLLAGGAVAEDLDGTGTAARFNKIRDITTDGVNIYILTKTKIRKMNLISNEVSTIPAYSDWSAQQNWIDGSRHLQATTDGSYVYFLGMTLYSHVARAKISDGSYSYIGSHGISGGYYTGIAWDGTSIYCSITGNNYLSDGYWQQYTYNEGTSSWGIPPGGPTGYWSNRGIAVTSNEIYMAHVCQVDAIGNDGPITRQTGTGGAATIIGEAVLSKFNRKIFTDGRWLFGYGITDNTSSGDRSGQLWVIK